MKTNLSLLSILLMLLVGSCKSYYLQKYCKPETRINSKDSTVVHIKDSTVVHIHDSTVRTKGGNMEANVGNPCDSVTGLLKEMNLKFKNGSNTTTIKTENGRLIVNSDCEDQISIYKEKLSYMQTKVDSFSSHKQEKAQTVERQLTWWERLKISGVGDAAWLMAMFSVLYFIRKLYKLKSNK